ncbi:MAG TPA: PSD1 and planctomycete cytochrome C domain-containing protein [Gemmataceae bacterium]|nr:PSD1 and planctomycete cytochrome C domain-containing protein [Gemmataceae bacterium]
MRQVAPLLLLVVAVAPAWAQPASNDDALVDFFERKVRPVLANNCYNCHSANTKAIANLRVDDRNGLVKGGNRGPAIIPGNPEKSLLIQAVKKTHAKVKMPPEHDLTAADIDALVRWVKDGAAWPAVRVPASINRVNPKYDKLRKEHWAWQPLRNAKAPAVKNAAWPRTDIDRFVLAKLEEKGLDPVADADRLTLIRRVTFDLTGLPPTLDDIDAFLNDKSPKAFEKVVDRLLASSAYGERWGRHWLDVARYAESTGSARNLPYPQAWRYRDYVIDAFNSDKPYDRFVREQIAGDLLPATTQQERDAQLIATGFLALGVKDVNQRFKVRFVMDNVDEQIDTVSRSVLALTASCARCHDHKFDPIPVADYYALAGIFQSSDHCSGLRNQMGGAGLAYYEPNLLLKLGNAATVEPDSKTKARIAELTVAVEKAKAEFNSIKGTSKGKEKTIDGRPAQMVARQKMLKLQAELLSLTDPAKDGQVALGVRDSQNVGDTEIRIRGEAEKLGPVVPRGFLTLLSIPDAPKVNPQQSGRLELSQWLTNNQNPLTQRVIVNRVWRHLFSKGIVSSVDNFGTTGDAPSHPELLDHLARKFVADGWSIKKLVRTIVLTRTYQLGHDAPKQQVAIDPANRLLWRHSPRRLDAEEIRDAMLAVSAQLDLRRPKASAAADLKVSELRNNAPEALRILGDADKSVHRSVYLPLLRTLTPRSLEVFDFAEQGMVTGNRDTTTVAPQSLYMLNDPFVLQQAQALAKRLLERGSNDDARVNLAFRWTLNRSATEKEIANARFFLGDYEARLREEASEPKVDARAEAWASFSQALLASAEFRFVR